MSKIVKIRNMQHKSVNTAMYNHKSSLYSY